MTSSSNNSSLLCSNPKTLSHWWTCVPVLPEKPEDISYGVLRRQWADHTMNTLRQAAGGYTPGSRGFYVLSREDHITTFLFEIWRLFPDASFAASLLRLWQIPHGQISQVRWSYSWEEPRDGVGRPDITDIVFSWRDELGPAVLVIEAKRPGGKLTEKDRAGGRHYLSMPTLRKIERRWVAYLVDQRDRAAAIQMLPAGTPLVTWQEMGRCQASCAGSLPVPADFVSRVQAYIARHYSELGLGFDEALAARVDGETFTGRRQRYDGVRALGLPGSVERFLLGSDVAFCARTGNMPEPPMNWLAQEPTLLQVIAAKTQTTAERRIPLWRLDDR